MCYQTRPAVVTSNIYSAMKISNSTPYILFRIIKYFTFSKQREDFRLPCVFPSFIATF